MFSNRMKRAALLLLFVLTCQMTAGMAAETVAAEDIRDVIGGIVPNPNPDPWSDDADYMTFHTKEEYMNASLEERELKINDPNTITDEDFYGKYNQQTGEWEIEGQINYDYIDYNFDCTPLKEAEDAVKAGDYVTAADCMLTYYQNKANYQNRSRYSSYSRTQKFVADLLAKNIAWAGASSGDPGLWATFRAKNEAEIEKPEDERITLDITDKLESQRTSNTKLLLAVGGMNKDGTRIRIRSREQTEYAPVIRAVIDGVVRELPCEADNYVSPGTTVPTGNEDIILVEESVSSIDADLAYDDNTKVGYIRFDLSGIEVGESVSSAEVVFYAVNESNKGSGEAVVCIDNGPALQFVEETDYYHSNGIRRQFVNFDGDDYMTFVTASGEYSEATRLTTNLMGFYAYGSFYGPLAAADEECPEFYQCCMLRTIMSWLHQDMRMKLYSPGNIELLYGTRTKMFVDLFMQELVYYPVLTTEIFSAMLKHMYIMGEWFLYTSPTTNNIGVQETGALLSIISNFPELKKTDVFRERFQQNLKLCLKVQWVEDGSSVEQALNYVSYGINGFKIWKEITDSAKVSSPYDEEMQQKLEGLCVYFADMVGPGYSNIGVGDGVGGSIDMGVCEYYGELFQNQRLIYAGAYGAKGQEPDYTSVLYDVGKKAVMRTGWGSRDNYLHINADAAWQSHGHADDLSVVVYGYGERLIADPGNAGYEQGEIRDWMEGSEAHNMVVVNGTDQLRKCVVDETTGEIIGEIGKRGIIHNWETNNVYDFIKLETLNQPGFQYDRSVLFIKPGFWIVSDFLDPEDTQSVNHYAQNWHTPEDANLTVNEITGAVSTNRKGPNLTIVPIAAEKYSDIYLQPDGRMGLTPNVPYAKMEQQTAGTVTFDTILYPTDTGNTVEIQTTPLEIAQVQPTDVSAFEMLVAESGKQAFDATYYILHSEEQLAERQIGDYTFNGSMLYVEKNNTDLQRLILADGTAFYDTEEHKTQVGEREDETLVLTDQNGTILFQALGAVPQLGIEINAGTLKISSSLDVDLTQLTVKRNAQAINRVLYNGTPVSFKDAKGYIYFGDAPILVGDDGPEDNKTTPQTPNHGGGSGSGGSSGSSGSVSSSTGGNISTVPNGNTGNPNATKPDDTLEQLKQGLQGHWAESEISFLIDRGIVQGVDGNLHLEANVTRAEFIALLVRSMGLSAVAYQGGYDDVQADAWYADTIQAAADAGIVQGSDGQMRPDDPITREEMAKMAVSAYEVVCPGSDVAEEVQYADADQISEWALNYIAKAAGLELIRGFEDGSFRPRASSLREQTMVVVYRMMQKMEEEA